MVQLCFSCCGQSSHLSPAVGSRAIVKVGVLRLLWHGLFISAWCNLFFCSRVVRLVPFACACVHFAIVLLLLLALLSLLALCSLVYC